ncbi:hypothetical protein QYE76_021737 [Lolium multiflorum]|uniref:Retrotransposon gag domain-containing protein n=1 Tax=Lolium multiflorum TaxID=4521 RepID=A0AAD8VT60_LOLMU|nr:hypothetical protein QYE76_021737 [Lolium multiflorum]
MAGEATSSSMYVRADGGEAQDGATVALRGGHGWCDEEDLAVAFLEVRLPASTPELLPATPRKLMSAATSPSSCRRQPLRYAAPGHLPNQLLPSSTFSAETIEIYLPSIYFHENPSLQLVGIDKSIPCQLVPSVGTRGDKELISMASSTSSATSSTSLVASNAMDGGKQIEIGLVDFVPHPPSCVDAYAYLEDPIEMTFGSFHFRVGKEGSHRLAIPNPSGSFAVDSDFSGSSSSFESGEEEISPSSFTRPALSGKLAKIFDNISFGSSTDSNISSDSDSVDNFDFIDMSTSVREVLTDLYDDVTDPEEDQTLIYHQICAIGESSRQEDEASEAFDDLGNPYIDPANLTQGLGNKYVRTTPRHRVQLPQEAWDRAARAMDGTEPMTMTATAEELQAYQYKLARADRELEKQRAEIDKTRAATSASSRRRAELSRHSGTSGSNHRAARDRGRSHLAHLPEQEREQLIQNLNMSFMSIDTRGNIIPKTPEAGYMATQAFILASRPPAGDLRETLYQMAMAGVGAMGGAFASPSTPQPESAPRRNSPRPTMVARDPPRTDAAKNTEAQDRVDRARENRSRRHSPEVAEEDMCGLPCFTGRVRRTKVPSGFKLPDSYKKFDSLQDPEDWLIDYLETVKLLGGTRATTMQSVQVHLSGAARSWIKKLPMGSIDNWETFEDLFVKNFRSTCKKPASIEQLRACKQKYGESMRAYIQRWNIIKNSAKNVSDERAIDAFVGGIQRKDLIEDLGRTNPRTIADLMDIVNRWANGEDVVHNDTSPTSTVDPNNVPLASLVAQEENVDVNFIKNNNFNNNAYRNNSGNNYRPYPSANGNGYGNSYGNSYNNNRSVPSGLEAMLKEFISTQTAFNKSVEEKLDKIDIIASRVDRLASDVNLLKVKVMPNNDIDNKITTTANAIQVRINENIRLMAELRARWDREENEKLAKENNVAKVWTITTTSNANSSHVAAPPTINGKIIGVGNVSTSSAKRTKLPEIAKTAETACDKTEIFSNLGNNDPIAVAHND